jgi:GNAT superfamily N-acetyltransferase
MTDSPPAPVRIAVAADAQALFKFAIAGHAQDALLSLSRPKMAKLIHDFTHHPKDGPLGIIGVIDAPDGEGIAASVALAIETFWYSDEHIVCERWINVLPPYRRLGYGKALIAFAKWVADNVNLPMEIGIMSLDRADAKIRFYRSQQLRPLGSYFAYGLDRCNGPAAHRVAAAE